ILLDAVTSVTGIDGGERAANFVEQAIELAAHGANACRADHSVGIAEAGVAIASRDSITLMVKLAVKLTGDGAIPVVASNFAVLEASAGIAIDGKAIAYSVTHAVHVASSRAAVSRRAGHLSVLCASAGVA